MTVNTDSTVQVSPTFGQVAFSNALVDEISPLLAAHYLEIAAYPDIPLVPDFAKYQRMAQLGLLRIYTVRENSKLMGYALFFVGPGVHYSTSIQAALDIIYLDPSLRGKLVGLRFIKWCDEQLRAEGVQVVYHYSSLRRNIGSVLHRLGYQKIQDLYAREL